MLLQDDHVTTSIRFNPLEPTRNQRTHWRVRLRVYGRQPLTPLLEEEFGPVGPGEQFEIRSADIARRLGVAKLEHYAELHPYSNDVAPSHEQIVAPVFAHYSSTDGSFAAHLPSAYMYGSARAYKIRSGYKYQNFPCVEIGGPFDVRVYSVNPNLRKVTYWVQLVAGDGSGVEEYGPFSMRPKSLDVWSSDRHVAGDRLRAVGVIIKSDQRIPSFVGIYNRSAQRMVGLDHTHPFFPT